MLTSYSAIHKLIAIVALSTLIGFPSLLKGQFTAPINLDVAIIDDIDGIMELSWECDPATGFQFFVIKRDGIQIGTLPGPSQNPPFWSVTDTVTNYGTYCYSVYAQYNTGQSAELADCVDWLAPIASISPTYHEYWLWPEEEFTTMDGILNTGGSTLAFSYLGFTGGTPPQGFIDVEFPINWVAPYGTIFNNPITFSAVGYDPGVYYQDLVIETNDPVNPTELRQCTMHVSEVAFINGMVKDSITQQGIPGVTVSSDYSSTMTLSDGSYILWVKPNTSDYIGFDKPGYVTSSQTFVAGNENDTTLMPDMALLPTWMFPGPTNLQVILIDDINGVVEISWDLVPGPGYWYTVVARNGAVIGTTTLTSYISSAYVIGETCFTVWAHYINGYSESVTDCVEIGPAEIALEPDALIDTLFPGSTSNNDIMVSDTGSGSLYYNFTNFLNPACMQQLVMYDDYGDGWNGATMDIFADGEMVLSSVTLVSGTGPEYMYFQADPGQEITTVFYCGGWCYECYYEIVDGYGNVIATDGANGNDPTGIQAGTCYADCPIYFITDVTPSSGIVPPWESKTATVSWDASGFSPGTYYEDLECQSNDTSDPVIMIQNTMVVLPEGYVSGTITNGVSPFESLTGVRVNSSQSLTRSLFDGSYILPVPAKSFNMIFEKPGYQLHSAPITATSGNTVFYDAVMMPACYPSKSVMASDQGNCDASGPALIEWSFPAGPEEIIYDDGEAEDYFAWAGAFNESAVRFSPASYPAILEGLSIYVGDGSFGSGWLGSQIAILVYEEGPGSMPGTLIDSVGITINNYDWIEISGLNDSILSGDFFISMMQINPLPYTPPIGVDLSTPIQNRSYTRPSGGSWSAETTRDFMIRAVVDEPITVNVVSSYALARVSDFDPIAGPETGTLTPLVSNLTNLDYIDNDFQLIPEGWYAYAVQVLYASGGLSPWSYSNTIGKSLGRTISFQVEDCIGTPVQGATIILSGNDWPEESFSGVSNASGNTVFDCVWDGSYNINIYHPGNDPLMINNMIIEYDTMFVFALSSTVPPPTNLRMDSLGEIFSWGEPLTEVISEDFQGPSIPFGWQISSNGTGWFLTSDGSSANFPILPWSSQYICVTDEWGGTSNDGSVDYLITPELNLQAADTFYLNFDHYFTGTNGQIATLEYSYDSGASWTLLQSMVPGMLWENITVELSSISGPASSTPVWLAFHADDGGGDASGWAIDNVSINMGSYQNILSYDVFLDSTFIVQTDTNFYQFSGLNYGQSYSVCVLANHACASSEQECIDFISMNTRAPDWIEGDTVDMNVELSWFMDTNQISNHLLGYRLYRDSILLDLLDYTGSDTIWYTDTLPDPMCYDYQVSALYGDLTSSDTLESAYTGPEEVCLVFGSMLPLFQDWTSGTFEPDWIPGDNWVMNMQMGNAEPSAEFTWAPILNDYEECIASGPINGVYPDTKSDPYTDGQFMLRFDVQLDNVNPTGNEYFKAEVWSNGEWNTVSEFSNANGSFEWETVEVDITEHAMGYVFKLRFMAVGEESSDILSWYVDNIEVFHYCAPPENVYARDNGYEIEVNWDIPLSSKQYNGNLLDHTGNIRSSAGDGLAGYNVFLNIEGAGYEFIDFTEDTFYMYEPPSFGLYCFYITSVYEGCESLMSNESCVIIPYWGLGEPNRDNMILIYPNPTDDRINIESDLPFNRLELIDLSGHTLMIQEAVHQQQATMDVSSLAPGVYLLRIDTKEGRAVRKIIIE